MSTETLLVVASMCTSISKDYILSWECVIELIEWTYLLPANGNYMNG